jgi:GNAT superfamily N-acetyltransferase
MKVTKSLDVCKAAVTDSSAIIKILKDRAVWLKEKGSTQWRFLLTGHEDEEIVRNVEAGFFYKVLKDETIIAIFLLSPKQDKWDISLWGKDNGNASSVYLHKLAVSVAFQGEQIGDFVMDWIKEQVPLMQVDRIRLDCVASSEYLLHFYQKHGFVLLHEVDDHYLLECPI